MLFYLDDIIVPGSTKEELKKLDAVLQYMKQDNLKFNAKKYVLFRKEMPFLRHVISSKKIRK